MPEARKLRALTTSRNRGTRAHTSSSLFHQQLSPAIPSSRSNSTEAFDPSVLFSVVASWRRSWLSFSTSSPSSSTLICPYFVFTGIKCNSRPARTHRMENKTFLLTSSLKVEIKRQTTVRWETRNKQTRTCAENEQTLAIVESNKWSMWWLTDMWCGVFSRSRVHFKMLSICYELHGVFTREVYKSALCSHSWSGQPSADTRIIFSKRKHRIEIASCENILEDPDLRISCLSTRFATPFDEYEVCIAVHPRQLPTRSAKQ